MTTELTKAAQQALEALKHGVAQLNGIGIPLEADPLHGAITALERALTQRPAAQTERDILNDSAWIAGAKFGWNCGVEGTRDLLNQCIEQRIKDRVEARASLPASQQATPATPEDIKVYDGIAAGYFADTQQATPEPVGDPVARVELMQAGGNAGLATRIVEIDEPMRERLRPGDVLYTRPAPGVRDAEDLRDRLVAISAAVADCDDRAAQSMLSETLRLLAAAQAKGGE